jgi:outer membrane protein OmpA-like peptidoglycan-associated protein
VFCDAEKSECYLRTPKTLLAKKTVAAVVNTPASEVETVQASVFFAFNDAKLNQITIVGLTQNLLSLKEAKSVWLRGWTDPVGGKSSLKNKKLAEQRIKAVLDWLQNNGLQNVQIEKLTDPPCCNPDPLYPTDKERAQQRRVDIVLKRTP